MHSPKTTESNKLTNKRITCTRQTKGKVTGLYIFFSVTPPHAIPSRAQHSSQSQRPKHTSRHPFLVMTTLYFLRYEDMSRNSLTPLLCLCTSGIWHFPQCGAVTANRITPHSLAVRLFLHQLIRNELGGRGRVGGWKKKYE